MKTSRLQVIYNTKPAVHSDFRLKHSSYVYQLGPCGGDFFASETRLRLRNFSFSDSDSGSDSDSEKIFSRSPVWTPKNSEIFYRKKKTSDAISLWNEGRAAQ